jgi:ribosome assembly protein RRB1
MQVYLPDQELAEDEELVVDNSAYDMLHSMGVEWPCLSFDILNDNLGMSRTSVCISFRSLRKISNSLR